MSKARRGIDGYGLSFNSIRPISQLIALTSCVALRRPRIHLSALPPVAIANLITLMLAEFATIRPPIVQRLSRILIERGFP